MMPMAVTMGDASGIGSEIILRRYAAGELDHNVLIYGDSEILKAGSELLDLLGPHVARSHENRNPVGTARNLRNSRRAHEIDASLSTFFPV